MSLPVMGEIIFEALNISMKNLHWKTCTCMLWVLGPPVLIGILNMSVLKLIASRVILKK